jgi:hypothetical protein
MESAIECAEKASSCEITTLLTGSADVDVGALCKDCQVALILIAFEFWLQLNALMLSGCAGFLNALENLFGNQWRRDITIESIHFSFQ